MISEPYFYIQVKNHSVLILSPNKKIKEIFTTQMNYTNNQTSLKLELD
ncbi:hypothetical protein BI355_1568 [Companilactobacillus crustorum]|nr:hypothetical protein BI355_1568 [Companilactobacillus crustorum]